MNLTCPPFTTSGSTECRSPPPTVPLLLCAYSLLHVCVYRPVTQQRQRIFFHCWERKLGNVFTEPLPSNGHMRHSIFPSKFRSSKRSLPFKLPDHDITGFSYLSNACYTSRPLVSLCEITRTVFSKSANYEASLNAVCSIPQLILLSVFQIIRSLKFA
jgi:hypothetical protein